MRLVLCDTTATGTTAATGGCAVEACHRTATSH
jgi:hypothetical protein